MGRLVCNRHLKEVRGVVGGLAFGSGNKQEQHVRGHKTSR